MDMAVGVIIGAAFGKIVASLVNDVLMPPIGKLLGGVDFTGLFISLGTQHYDTLKAAKMRVLPPSTTGCSSRPSSISSSSLSLFT